MLREVKLKEEEHPWIQTIRYGQTYGKKSAADIHRELTCSRYLEQDLDDNIRVFRVIPLLALCSPYVQSTATTRSSSSTASSNPTSLYAAPTSLITAADYLNASASDPPPFAFCPVFGPGDAIAEKRGQWGLLRSRLHMGSGARVQKLVQKAMAGGPITISVLGGSSECQS
jgi:hypothetical protein